MRLRWAASAALSATVLLLGSCGGTTLNATPVITALSPETIPATLIGPPNCTSGNSFTVNVTGNNFLANSVVYWNGSKRNSTFNADTGQLAATITACDIASPGIAYISVSNPPPGGGTTVNAASFQITQPPNPAPSISSLSPASTAQNTLPTGGILTINGAPAVSGSNSPAFTSASQAAINGSARATTFVSATELQVQMLASDVATVGSDTVTVTNPGPGGGVSSAVFSVTDPPNGANFPQVVSVSATGGAANGASSSPAMSADGRYVAFYSQATNLVASGASGNIFVRDTCVGATNCTPHTIAVDLAPDGSAPNAQAESKLAISADGRYLAFASNATNLLQPSVEAPNPTALTSSIFVRDLCVGATAPSGCSPHTTQVSLGMGAAAPNGNSFSPSLSSDGRTIAFGSAATNLVAGTSTVHNRVYAAILCQQPNSASCSPHIELASVDNLESNDLVAQQAAISGDGRYVAFSGWPSSGGNRSDAQIYLRDICLGSSAPRACVPSTTAISAAADGSDGNSRSAQPSVNGDGRFVVFVSTASNLAPLPANRSEWQLLLRDTCLGASAPKACTPATSLISAGPAAAEPMNAFGPSISSSGRYISFAAVSAAVPESVNHAFVHDTCFGANSSTCALQTVMVSATNSGEAGNNSTHPQIALSGDGQIRGFGSNATNLASPTSGLGDVFLMQMPTTQH